MISYGLKLSEVEDVIRGCGLNILRECKPLPLGDKYILEAEGQRHEYCQIILSTAGVPGNDNDPNPAYKSSCDLTADNEPIFYGAIVKTEDIGAELQYTQVHRHEQVKELMEKLKIEAVGCPANPFWYRRAVGSFPGNNISNHLDKESLEEAIQSIQRFECFIGELNDKMYKWGHLPVEYIDWLAEKAISDQLDFFRK